MLEVRVLVFQHPCCLRKPCANHPTPSGKLAPPAEEHFLDEALGVDDLELLPLGELVEAQQVGL